MKNVIDALVPYVVPHDLEWTWPDSVYVMLPQAGLAVLGWLVQVARPGVEIGRHKDVGWFILADDVPTLAWVERPERLGDLDGLDLDDHLGLGDYVGLRVQ